MCLIKVRTGAGVSNDEILGFAMLFNDALTLDNISRLAYLQLKSLISVALYMNIIFLVI